MTATIQEEINHIVELKSQVTRLDNLVQGYRLCARNEGKSEKTIQITLTALTTLRDFLESREYSTCSPNLLDILAYCYLVQLCGNQK